MKTALPFAAIIISLLLSSCSLGRLFTEETRRENARIYLNDGNVLTGKAVLPNLKDKHIYLSMENGGRKRISSDDINSSVYWEKGSPENRNIFVYREFSSKSKTKGPFWMKTVGSGNDIEICLCGAYYSFGDKGEISVEAALGDYVYIIGFKNNGKGEFIANADGSSSSVRSAIIKWLSDDPVLCGKLIDRVISAKDYETICAEYNPVSDNLESTAI